MLNMPLNEEEVALLRAQLGDRFVNKRLFRENEKQGTYRESNKRESLLAVFLYEYLTSHPNYMFNKTKLTRLINDQYGLEVTRQTLARFTQAMSLEKELHIVDTHRGVKYVTEYDEENTVVGELRNINSRETLVPLYSYFYLKDHPNTDITKVELVKILNEDYGFNITR